MASSPNPDQSDFFLARARIHDDRTIISSLIEDPDLELGPDPGTEGDFKVENNPLAFTPVQLNKLQNPRKAWKIPLGPFADLMSDKSIFDQAVAASTSTRSFLPVVIKGKTFNSLPDTNAPCNVMDEEMAYTLGIPVDRDPRKQRTFTNALGQRSRSSGVTNIQLSFPSSSTRWLCEFAVMRKCAAPLVIGDPFLRLTQTMDKFRHRLKRIPMAMTALNTRAWRLMHMEMPRRKMNCYVDGEQVFSNVDSGADADFASLEYSLFREWDIQPLRNDEGYVILADQQITKVLGFVDIDVRIRSDARKRRLYILDGLVCNVLLGDETIDAMNIFTECQDSFLHVDVDAGFPLSSAAEKDEFCIIRWADFYDEVADFVDESLGIASVKGVGSSGNSSRKGKFLSKLSFGTRRTRSLNDRDIELGLMRKLEEVDIMEARFQLEAKALLSTATGDALDDIKRRDLERRRKHQAIRQKIKGLIQQYHED